MTFDKIETMKNLKYSVWEEGLVHTSNLTEKEADELLNRLKTCYPDLEFFKAETTKREPKH